MYVYHERQAAALCGRHAVNNLLQGPHFSDFDLSGIALSLDQREAALLDPGGGSPSAVSGVSNNVDDSGTFSVDTLREALKQRGVEFSCEKAIVERALTEPDKCTAFMLNQNAHWIALRRFGSQWLNLNSLLESPELVSDFFLSAFLAQLRTDRWSVFVVSGTFPPATPPQFHERELWHDIATLEGCNNTRSKQAAAERKSAASRAQETAVSDPDFEAALRASLSDGGSVFSSPQARGSDDDDLRRAIAASLASPRHCGGSGSGSGNASGSGARQVETVSLVEDEDDELARAHQLSLAPPLEACLARFSALSLILGAEPIADGSASAPRCARLSLRCPKPIAAPWPGSYPDAAPFVAERRFVIDAPISIVFVWAELEWLRAFIPASALTGDDKAAITSSGAARAAPFALIVAFPRKVLRAADDERSIEACGLAPSAVLTLATI